jgi:demethylmenaquinone methyltransferase/2-methoxy-6-polyprenyl-1,4-benzoquinol methylase
VRRSEKSGKSDIETSGIAALFYDQLVYTFTLGTYHTLLKRVIADIGIEPGDHILDMGSGTGKNALLMNRYLREGSITALEIGEAMRKQFRRKCGGMRNITLENLRIEKPLPYQDRFDKVFISYVLHGFERNHRSSILGNAYRALRPGGRLLIFDWNEFDLNESGPLMRFFMNHIECSPALDFIRQDLRTVLLEQGFREPMLKSYFKNQIRLLSCTK